MFEAFTDENGKRSMSRIVLFIAVVVFAIIAIADGFSSSVEVHASVYQIIQLIVAFGLGGQTVRTSISNSKGKFKTGD